MLFIFQHINYRALVFFCIVFSATIKAAENYLADTLTELHWLYKEDLKINLEKYCTTVNNLIGKKHPKKEYLYLK